MIGEYSSKSELKDHTLQYLFKQFSLGCDDKDLPCFWTSACIGH